MNALILLLFNLKEKTYHPIFYIEKFFPGPELTNLIRYKSKGHHTTGFQTIELAKESAEKLKLQLEDSGHNVNLELDQHIEWDGLDIPADTQLRTR